MVEWNTIIGKNEPPYSSVLLEIMLPIALTLPLSGLGVWLVATKNYNFGFEIHDFISFALGYLLVVRLEMGYKFFWEARHHVTEALVSMQALGVVTITQYHRHFSGNPGPEIHMCVDDVRRYLLLYFCTMVNLLEGQCVEQENMEGFVTKEEFEILRQSHAPAPMVCIKWLARRLTQLEEMGYLSPLQLHETNESIEGMAQALSGLQQHIDTPPPFKLRQLASGLTYVYVFTAPFALATRFLSQFTHWSAVLGRSLLSTVLLGLTYFALNQVAKNLENPCRPHRTGKTSLDMQRMCHEAAIEMRSLFEDQIPPVAGVLDPRMQDAKKAAITKLILDASTPTGGGQRGGQQLPIRNLRIGESSTLCHT